MKVKEDQDIAMSDDDLDNDWLASVSAEEQIDEMRAWFLARYEDPANTAAVQWHWLTRKGKHA